MMQWRSLIRRGVVIVCAAAALSRAGAEGTNAYPSGLSPEAVAYTQSLAARTHSNTTAFVIGAVTNVAVAGTNTALLSADALDDTVKLGLGDRLSFRILEDKDDPKTLMVADSGELEVPYLGRVMAKGKTCRVLASEIKTALEKKYYYHATVILDVDLLSKSHGRVYIAGRVHVPGFQDIPTDETYTAGKAILRAGGFTDFADKRHVKITRKQTAGGTAQDVVQIVDLGAVLERGQEDKDVALQPDDLIYVPARMVNF